MFFLLIATFFFFFFLCQCKFVAINRDKQRSSEDEEKTSRTIISQSEMQ